LTTSFLLTSIACDLVRLCPRPDAVSGSGPGSIFNWNRWVSIQAEPTTVSELLHGVHRAVDERARNRRAAFVEGLLSALDPLPVTAPVARTHARIWAGLERKGTMIGPHDLWIAATAVTHGMDVATANAAEFGRVPGLAVVAL
jgi:tRNA(fMet)-specific endonuclease VapC